MHAEIVGIDVTSDWQTLKGIDESFVNTLVIVVLIHDLLSEGEVLSHGSALVVSSQHRDVFWVCDFERVKENENFERVVTSVDIVTKEKKVGPT